MRVAVIGHGSIGRRHAAILIDLGHEVVVYDPRPGDLPTAGAVTVDSFEAALEGAAAAVIASPSSNHASQARRAIEWGIPTLVEKPLAMDSARAAELEWLAHERGVLLSVAMNLRHHAGVLALRDLLQDGTIGRVARAGVWCGSWLPGWRPGTDYRTSYSAQSALGGGVLLDVAAHELDYLLWLLGPAASVTALTRRVSSLELDAEDVGVIALELRSGAVAEVVVDYFDQAYHRGCRLVGERGTAHWSWEQERLTLRGGSTSHESVVPSDVGPAYRRQLEHFVAAVSGDCAAVCTAGEARDVLSVIDAARISSSRGTRIALAPSIRLRAAGRSDSDQLLAWRNDPGTRRWSRSQDEVSIDEHRAWLEQALADDMTTIWIAEAGDRAIAQIRLTRHDLKCAELHITVAPDARGRGIGAALVVEGAARALATGSVERLIAHVKEDNEASLRAFARAGFAQGGFDDAGLLRLERKACR